MRVLVLYGTTDGQTGKIAGELAASLCAMGCLACAVNADGALKRVRARHYAGVIVAASVHASGYQRSVRRWIRANALDLERLPTAFVSVCLGVLEGKPAVDRKLSDIARRFVTSLGWTPGEVKTVAGALRYTRYSWLKKLVMRRIAARAGGGTDTTRDYEYTNWDEVRSFARQFALQHELAPRVSLNVAYSPPRWSPGYPRRTSYPTSCGLYAVQQIGRAHV